MKYLTVQEKMEVLLVYGEAIRSLDNVVDINTLRIPYSILSRVPFYRTIKHFTTEGYVQRKQHSRNATITGENSQVVVLGAVTVNPRV